MATRTTEMRVALATHTLNARRGYPESSREAQITARRNLYSWARQHNFAGIEVGAWWYDFYQAPVTETRQLKEEMAAEGLALAGFNCLRKCVTHPAVATQNRRDLWTAVEVACEVGVPVVSISLSLDADAVDIPQQDVRGTQISPGSSRDAGDEEFEQAGAFLRELARVAQPSGIEIALELHHCSLADTSHSLLRLLDIAGEPNISANPDLGNVTWGYAVPEEPWPESVIHLAGRVRFWHVKNIQRVYFPEVGRSAFVHAALGEGDIDYRWAIAHMQSAGFDGWLSLEAAGPGDWLSFAARGKAYLDELQKDFAAESSPEVGV